MHQALHSPRAHTPRVTVDLSIASPACPFLALWSPVSALRGAAQPSSRSVLQNTNLPLKYFTEVFLFYFGKFISQRSLNKSQYSLINKCVTIFPFSIIIEIYFHPTGDEEQAHSFNKLFKNGIATDTRKIIGWLSLFPALLSPIHSSHAARVIFQKCKSEYIIYPGLKSLNNSTPLS